jgi:hypothetical protein
MTTQSKKPLKKMTKAELLAHIAALKASHEHDADQRSISAGCNTASAYEERMLAERNAHETALSALKNRVADVEALLDAERVRHRAEIARVQRRHDRAIADLCEHHNLSISNLRRVVDWLLDALAPRSKPEPATTETPETAEGGSRWSDLAHVWMGPYVAGRAREFIDVKLRRAADAKVASDACDAVADQIAKHVADKVQVP